jgi:hypothetical protein
MTGGEDRKSFYASMIAVIAVIGIVCVLYVPIVLQ